MKTAVVTHSVDGIRINIDGVIHSWSTPVQLAESHAFSIVGAQRMEKFRAEVMHVADVLTAAVERSGTDGAFFVNPRDLLNAALKDSA